MLRPRLYVGVLLHPARLLATLLVVLAAGGLFVLILSLMLLAWLESLLQAQPLFALVLLALGIPAVMVLYRVLRASYRRFLP